MPRWIGLGLLAIAFTAQSQECSEIAPAIQLAPADVIEGQRLALPGQARLQFGLGDNATTFAHTPDILIIKYGDGAVLSHRQLAESEMRSAKPGSLSFDDFIRLVFKVDVPGRSDADLEEAKAIWGSIEPGCKTANHYRRDGIDIYTYSQVRAGNEQYSAFFILDGDIVHYIDVTNSDALASDVLSTLGKRN